MALLFVNGVMNLLWIAALAAFVLIEKIAHKSSWLPMVTGGFLVTCGIYILFVNLGS